MTITYKTEYQGSEIVVAENSTIDLLVTLHKLEKAGLIALPHLGLPDLSQYLSEADLPTRVKLALERHGITTVAEYLKLGDKELFGIRNFGPKGLEAMNALLASMGLRPRTFTAEFLIGRGLRSPFGNLLSNPDDSVKREVG